MAYDMFFGKLQMPITPEKIKMKIGNANKTVTLINEGEVNILKSAPLTEISFDLLIPAVQYGFAKYRNSVFHSAAYFLEAFELLKTSKEPFQFIVNRTFPDGKALYDTNLTVSLEEYSVKEDVKNGFDVTVSVTLKQYCSFGTKKYSIKKSSSSKTTATAKKKRSGKKANSKNTTYTVKKGDSLWKIAQKFYGDGSKYPVIYKANKKKIKKPSLIYAGQVFTIPAA